MKFLCFCLLATTVFFELLLPTLANPDGFLNINCGASENETRDDGLLWVSDSPYSNVRSRKSLALLDNELYLPFKSISYFTDLSQKKYCYLLPVKPGTHYLVRTQFDYGDFKFHIPLASLFDLLIGGVRWTKLDLRLYTTTAYEIILATISDRLCLCLARNSQTQPHHYVFISTIELRQLNSSMYKRENADFDKSALIMIRRKNFGGRDLNYRLDKSDQYDRFWYSYSPKGDLGLLNLSDSLGTGLPNQVPQKVLQTAVSAKEIKDVNISDAFPSLNPGSYYFLFYFCNLNLTATSGTTNSFRVRINDEETDWVEFTDHLQCKHLDQNLQLGTTDTNIKVVLSPLKNSASKPFINGAELYKILEWNYTDPEDVLAITEIAEAGNFPDNWSGADPCLPPDYSSTGITCNKENPPRVIIIDLTNMGLVGDIPPSIAKLSALTKLLLGNNSLSGPVPDFSPLKNLTTLQLQNNQLEGSIPTSLEKLSLLNQLYLQNNSLTGTMPRGLLNPGLDLRVDPQIKFPAPKRDSWPMGILVGCSMLLVLVVISTAFKWRHRHPSQPYTDTKHFPPLKEQHAFADVENQSEYCTIAIEYTEDDIKAATKNYSTVIGKGSFGSVFYGRFSGYDVAVKVLSTDSNQCQLKFYNEFTLLSRIHHRSLVNLVGYCRQPVLALIYEYMKCGSLEDHLYGVAKMEKPLDWFTRLNIVLQTAEGLLYLHHRCNPPIIHRNIKCNSILLDGNMCAKISDFGLSKVLESSKSYISTNMKGTFDYLDPEYSETSALTTKSDVYSFGVVLLEIISGISPRDGIVESGRKMLSCGRLVEVIDPSLGGRYNIASARKVAEIAYACTKPKSIDRPKMSVVVKELRAAVALREEDVNGFEYFSITR